MARFGDFLARARDVQRDVYGVEASSLSPQDWATYVVAQLHAGHVELGEVAQELPLRVWKPGYGVPTPSQIEYAAIEIIDVLCFVSNVLVALGVDDDRLNELYDAKVAFTRRRDS